MAEEPSAGIKVRDWLTRRVDSHAARLVLIHGAHAAARVRGWRLERAHQLPALGHLYAASSPKAGSQWMRALFDHPVVRQHTGLMTLPQLDYRKHPEKELPVATFVPGFYVSYDDYRKVPRRLPHRIVYMFRDPRDLMVSGYYSTVSTHRKVGAEMERFRDRVRAMPFDEGLLEMIHDAAPRLREMASWVDAEAPELAKFKLEDVSADPAAHVPRMLEHCEVHLSPAELETVLGETSRESLQAKDLAHREDGEESHYRVDRKSFRELFQPMHHEAVEQIIPGVVARLGYPE